MGLLINNSNVQHFTNKMCNAENRLVGKKKLPDALNEIDELLDEMKNQFDSEYDTPLSIQVNNEINKFAVGFNNDGEMIESVENGFSDIVLSGNTLVNLASTKEPAKKFYKNDRRYILSNSASIKLFKPLTTYTVAFKVDSIKLDGVESINILVELSRYGLPAQEILRVNAPGYYIATFTTSELNSNFLNHIFQLKGVPGQWENSLSETREITLSGVVVLEGDYTNRPPRGYFQGMRSVGEGDGVHKINIVSTTKNILADSEFTNANNEWLVYRGRTVGGYNGFNGYEVKYDSAYDPKNGDYSDMLSQVIYDYYDFYNCIKPNSWYTLSFFAKGDNSASTYIYPSLIDISTRGFINGEETVLRADGYLSQPLTKEWKKYTYTFKTRSVIPCSVNTQRLLFRAFKNNDYDISCVMLEQGKTASEYEAPIKDEINIPLNEPLRGIPGGAKDTIEKINGEWKLVRRCAVVSFVGNESWSWIDGARPDNSEFITLYVVHDESLPFSNMVSDKQRILTQDEWNKKSVEGIYKASRGLAVVINSSKLSSITQTAFKEWLKNNPFDVVYELAKPIIEDIDPVTLRYWKGGFIDINDKIPTGSTYDVAINKISQIKRNIDELTKLRKRVVDLENMVETETLNQSLQYEILKQNINLDRI